MNSLVPLKLIPFQNLMDFDALSGATRRMKLDEFHDYIDSEFYKNINAPLVYLLDEKNKKYGVEIFGNYRVEKVKKSPQLLLKIKNSQGNFEIYNYDHSNLKPNENSFAPPMVDYRWILDTFLNHDHYTFNSFLPHQSSASMWFNLEHVVRIIKIAEYFDCVEYLNLELLFNLAMKHNLDLGFDDVDSKKITDLFRYFLEESETIVPRQPLSMGVDMLKLLKREFKSLLNARWKAFYTIQHEKIKLSSYVKFIDACSPYMEKIQALNKTSKPQLWYSFFFEHAFVKLNDPNAFSYDNMVTNWDTCIQNFTFPQKSSLRNFNKLTDTYYLSNFITPLNVKHGNFGKKNWQIFMYWLTYGEMYDFKLKGRQVRHFNEAPVLNFVNRIAGYQISTVGPQIAKALDFFVNYFLNLEKCIEAELAKLRERYKQGLIDGQELNHRYNTYFYACDRDLYELQDFLCHIDEHGVPVNVLEITPKTSFKSIHAKIKKWHEELAIKALNDLKASENFIYKHLLPEPHQIGESVFTPLCDSHSISREGVLMSHCVATFRQDVSEGKYVVFSVQRQDERATLGVHLKYDEEENPFFVFSQCFKHSNRLVSDDLRADTNEFVHKLNKHPEIIIKKYSFIALNNH